ncbi:PTS-dependent dihydroxyacetone kinase 1, dihydroxyacetone-binding subunit DhaK-like isoform X2 [Bacillus rossius redtenbacheri]
MQASKKLINGVDTCVDEMLEGVVAALPGLCLHRGKRVVLVDEWMNRGSKAGIISGGGSGHEPFSSGYVGKGMLTASVVGSVFASPPASTVLHAIRKVCQGTTGGALLVVPNYTGDVLNCGVAMEQAKNEGLRVVSSLVAEDCALLSEDGSIPAEYLAGRRGMCGLLFVFKITGAMAELGKSLDEIHATAVLVNSCMANLGVCLQACSLPGSGPLFEVEPDEMELGLGVHGEAGREKLKLRSASETVKIMLKTLTSALKLVSGDEVAVLINNLGATSQLEQWIVAYEVQAQLSAAGICVQRLYAGLFMTSLDMAGVQVCVLRLRDHEAEWLQYLDADTDASGWPGCPLSRHPRGPAAAWSPEQDHPAPATNRGPTLTESDAEILKQCLKKASQAVVASEQRLNELDSGCGDGDCGTTLRLFTEGILNELDALELARPASLLVKLSAVAEATMGGTSGAIYSLMLTTASSALEQEARAGAHEWARAWAAGLAGVMRYSTARLGDRTMLDALLPACSEFEKHPKESFARAVEALQKAVKAAQDGCNKTKHMIARAGRASYVSAEHIRDVDAGAFAVTVWLQAIYQVLANTAR